MHHRSSLKSWLPFELEGVYQVASHFLIFVSPFPPFSMPWPLASAFCEFLSLMPSMVCAAAAAAEGGHGVGDGGGVPPFNILLWRTRTAEYGNTT